MIGRKSASRLHTAGSRDLERERNPAWQSSNNRERKKANVNSKNFKLPLFFLMVLFLFAFFFVYMDAFFLCLYLCVSLCNQGINVRENNKTHTWIKFSQFSKTKPMI